MENSYTQIQELLHQRLQRHALLQLAGREEQRGRGKVSRCHHHQHHHGAEQGLIPLVTEKYQRDHREEQQAEHDALDIRLRHELRRDHIQEKARDQSDDRNAFRPAPVQDTAKGNRLHGVHESIGDPVEHLICHGGVLL